MRWLEKPLRDVALGLRSREVTSAELLHEAAERAQATEPQLNAYKTWGGAQSEEMARSADAAFRSGKDSGALQGVPVSVKDLYGVPGLPIFAGTPRELPEAWRSPGAIARRLIAQHAVITGKTHTVEFAFGALGLNAHWATPRNPWDAVHHRVPGGSSSGAGVSLCQGSALVALGTDTAGSVRIPASVTGNVGYKPTRGRWPTTGIVPLSALFDTPGILARTVSDACFAAADFDRHGAGADFARIDSAPHVARPLRIGVPDRMFWDDCDAGIAEGVRSALNELAKSGHDVKAIAFPEAEAAFDVFRAGATAAAELLAFLRQELPEWIPTLHEFIGTRVEASAHLPAVEFLERVRRLETLARATRLRFDDIDVIATATAPLSPPRVDELVSWEVYRAFNLRMVRNTSIANLLGLNALTLPVALDAARMPVGLQIMAAPGRDDLLFAAGVAIEQALGPARQRRGAPP